MTEQEDSYLAIFTITTSNRSTLLSTVASICRGVKCENILINFVFDKRSNFNFNSFYKIKELLQKKHVNYKILIKEFEGISHARNYGFKKYKSNFHIFIDDDVILSACLLSILKDILKKKYQYKILFVPMHKEYINSINYNPQKIYINSINKKKLRLDPYYRSTCKVFEIKKLEHLKWITCIGRCIILYTPYVSSKTIHDRFDESFKGWGVEDIEYGYRQQKTGTKIRKIPISCIHMYHKIPNSHLEELKTNLFSFEKKYPTNFSPVGYRLFTFGKLTLLTWANIEETLSLQNKRDFYYMNLHMTGKGSKK